MTNRQFFARAAKLYREVSGRDDSWGVDAWLARRLNLSATTIYRWRAGRFPVSDEAVERLLEWEEAGVTGASR